MKKLILALLLVLLSVSLAWAQPGPRPGLLVDETDGSPSVTYVYKLRFSPGALTVADAVGTVSSGATALDDVSDPDANTSISFGAYEFELVSTTDQWGGVEIYSHQGTLTGETKTLSLKFDPAKTDTNITWIDLIADADGTPESIFKVSGAATRPQLTGDIDIIVSAVDVNAASSLKVGGAQIDIDDLAGTASYSGTGNIQTTGLLGGKFDDDCGTDATLDVAAATHYGGCACNGRADVIEIDLDAAVVGMSILVVDKTGGAITLDPNGTDVIVYDGTAAAAGEAIISSGAKGDFAALICLTANEWIVLGHDGNGWTEASP